jgi:SAM-dependent methyltransferase
MRTSKKEGNSSARSDTSADEDFLDQYEVTAKYYDIWYEDFTEDVEFLKRMAERTGGPILDCMCGTGRTLLPLAKEGYEISGFDASEAMLDKLTAKIEVLPESVQENVHIGHGDVRNFVCKKKFKLVIIPFNAFLHLLETEEQEAALKNVVDHMAKDGLFIMSIFNPRLDRPEGLLRHRGTRVTSTGEIITKMEAQEFDTPEQTTTIHYFYDISRQDQELRRVTATLTLRYMFEREVVDLLERCGLEVAEEYGDYLLSPFKKTSDVMVFVARKSA